MDERAPQSRTGTEDAHSAASAEADARAGRPPIDGAGTHDEADLQKVLSAIAAKIDVILDENVAADGEPDDRRRADQVESSVPAKHATDDSSALRRRALATTVLRISADGRVDVDDRKGDAIADAAHEAAHEAAQDAAHDAGQDAGRDAAWDVARDVARGGAENGAVDVAEAASEGSTEGFTVGSAQAAPPRAVQTPLAHEVTAGPVALAADDRSDVEDRLRAVRERLAKRRAGAPAARFDAPAPRHPRTRTPAWRRTGTRLLVKRLLIGLAIVGTSAIVSILLA